MGTPVSDFYETIRFLLGDHDATVRQYPDEVLGAAVRSCIRLQRVPGISVASQTDLTPEVTDPNKWALVAYHTVKGFVDSNPDRYSYRTRAIGETFGSWRNFLDELGRSIYKLENGKMFSTWQSYYTWLAGASGLPLVTLMANINVRAPFYNVTLGLDGVSGGPVNT